MSSVIGKASIEDPEYAFLYMKESHHSYNPLYRVVINNKQAYLSYVPPEKHQKNLDIPQLYLHSPKTNETRLINFPDIKNKSKKQEILIKEISHLTLSPSTTSPDGYYFNRNYRSHGNIMTELFGSRRSYNQNHLLTKGPKTYIIPDTKSHHVGFIGWVISEEE